MSARPFVKTRFGAGVLCGIAMACLAASAATPKITTVAGGFVGDGKQATAASFAEPVSVVRDARGNIYVGDTNNCRIRKINNGGIISTYAGTGICGFGGDGGPAAAAMISTVWGLTFDHQGNLLLADEGNNRVRKIDAAGTITTIAGTGTFGYTGDGGPAIQATLGEPISVSVDPTGNMYIADGANYVIRLVDTAGNIRTVAGNHTFGYSGDGGPATSAEISFSNAVLAGKNGTFYIADSGNSRVRKVDATGVISTYAGDGLFGNSGSGGPATSASIGNTDSLLLSGGKLYIGTGANLWTVNQSTQVITLIGGSASGVGGFNGDGNPALSTNFGSLWGIASDGAGGLLVTDGGNNRVRRITGASQIVTTIAGGFVGDGGKATAASLNFGQNAHSAFDAAGNLYFADSNNNRVRKVSAAGIITTFAGTGIASYSGDGGPASLATLNNPASVIADAAGNIFIADNGNGAIRKVDSTGTITTFVSNFTTTNSSQLATAYALAFDHSGNLYASDGLWLIWKITPTGTTTVFAGVLFNLGYNGDGIPATQAFLFLPRGIAFDSAGNLYIADWLNDRIRKVDTSGIISTIAGNGTGGFSGDGGPATSAMLSLPTDVAVDSNGKVYIADWINFRVRTVNSAGTIQTFAGTGGFGYNGEGITATQANLFPSAVTVRNGTVYVSDQGSYRVRKIR